MIRGSAFGMLSSGIPVLMYGFTLWAKSSRQSLTLLLDTAHCLRSDLILAISSWPKVKHKTYFCHRIFFSGNILQLMIPRRTADHNELVRLDYQIKKTQFHFLFFLIKSLQSYLGQVSWMGIWLCIYLSRICESEDGIYNLVTSLYHTIYKDNKDPEHNQLQAFIASCHIEIFTMQRSRCNWAPC